MDSEASAVGLLAAADYSLVDFADLDGFAAGSPVVAADFASAVAGSPVAAADSFWIVCFVRYPLHPCFVLCLYDADYFFQGF